MKSNILKFLILIILVTVNVINIKAVNPQYTIDGIKYEIFNSTIRHRDEAMVVKDLGSTDNTTTHISVPEEVTINGKIYKVTNLAKYAFSHYTALTSITFSDSLRGMQINTFYGCKSLTDIKLSESITRIFANTFDGCSALKSITIPNSVTTIDGKAFYNCTSLTQISIPKNVNTIGYEAFYNTPQLKNFFFQGAQPQIISSSTGSTSNIPFSTLPKSANIYVFKEFASTYTLNKNYYNIIIIDEINSNNTIPFSFTTDDPLILKSDATSSVDLLLKEDVVITAKNGINIDLTITDDKYYFFSLPFDCAVEDITGGVDSVLNSNNYGTEWIIKKFDGAKHALYGNESTDATNTEKYAWDIVQDSDTLKAGDGYIVALNQNSTLTVDNTATLYFPSKDSTNIEYKHSKNSITPTPFTPINVAKNESTQRAYSGWNLISTNLLHSVSNINIMVGDEEIKYVSIPNSDGISYTQVETADADLTAYKSFFIQSPNDGEVEISYTNDINNVKSNSATNDNKDKIVLSISADNNSFKDKTTILLNDDYTNDYVINQDLRKWQCENQTQIYSESNGTELCYNTLPYSSVTNNHINLSVITPNYYSTHTITLETYNLSNYPNKYLILEDKYLNKKIPLSAQFSYSFVPNGTKVSDRFEIYLSDSAYTDVDNIKTTSTFDWYIQNGTLFIEQIPEKGNISIYSTNGQLVYNKKSTQSSETINTNNLPSGSYILQIENKELRETVKISIQ